MGTELEKRIALLEAYWRYSTRPLGCRLGFHSACCCEEGAEPRICRHCGYAWRFPLP